MKNGKHILENEMTESEVLSSDAHCMLIIIKIVSGNVCNLFHNFKIVF